MIFELFILGLPVNYRGVHRVTNKQNDKIAQELGLQTTAFNTWPR